MNARLWFAVLFFLTTVGTLTAAETTIVLTFQPQSVGYSGTWSAKVVDRLARSWDTGEVPASELSPVVLNVTPFDQILAQGPYEIKISNNLVGCPPAGVIFLDSILVNFPDNKTLVYHNISPSSSGQKVQLSFLYYPIE